MRISKIFVDTFYCGYAESHKHEGKKAFCSMYREGVKNEYGNYYAGPRFPGLAPNAYQKNGKDILDTQIINLPHKATRIDLAIDYDMSEGFFAPPVDSNWTRYSTRDGMTGWSAKCEQGVLVRNYDKYLESQDSTYAGVYRLEIQMTSDFLCRFSDQERTYQNASALASLILRQYMPNLCLEINAWEVEIKASPVRITYPACHDGWKYISGHPLKSMLKSNCQRMTRFLSRLAERLSGGPYQTAISLGVTSGYRTPEHNKEVGGKLHSFHCQGLAVDFASGTVGAKFLESHEGFIFLSDEGYEMVIENNGCHHVQPKGM